jgi:hypothetical protein
MMRISVLIIFFALRGFRRVEEVERIEWHSELNLLHPLNFLHLI